VRLLGAGSLAGSAESRKQDGIWGGCPMLPGPGGELLRPRRWDKYIETYIILVMWHAGNDHYL
jgi:hypothetical protein